MQQGGRLHALEEELALNCTKEELLSICIYAAMAISLLVPTAPLSGPALPPDSPGSWPRS